MSEPEHADLERRLKRSQRLNAALLAVSLFLFVVLIAQQSGGSNLTQAAPTTAARSSAAPAATVDGSATAAGTATPSPTAALAAQVARHQADDPMAWGGLDAPVVMVQWTDFRCPFCAAFATQTLPTIFEKYIDTGKLRFELHDAAFFGDQSVDAAVAARAAGAQGRYHEFMSALYAAAPPSGHPDLPKAKLIGFAKAAHVPDLDKFTAALDDKTLRTQVTDSTTKAQSMGVTSVPFFVIGNQVVSGAQPAASFQQVIEAQLAALGR